MRMFGNMAEIRRAPGADIKRPRKYSRDHLIRYLRDVTKPLSRSPSRADVDAACQGGTLSKGGGSFKIDHPLDPENKFLYHSFVESPDMKNIYDGTVTTDANGDAVVTLPDWFEALNRDFRYQLTVIGTFAQAMVAEEINANRFAIKTSLPGVKVSWQVTGIRQDAWANKNRIPVEQNKPDLERGYYLHPDAFGLPEERGLDWARDPEGMTRRRQQLEAEEALERKSRQHR